MLKRCEAILERSISAPAATRTHEIAIPSPVKSRDVYEDQTITCLLKDESLCAWNSEFFEEEEEKESVKRRNKKYDVIKPSVVGLHVKKSHFYVNSRYRSKQNAYSKDQNLQNECSFVHYTDSRQFIEEYRKNKILRMRKELEGRPHDGSRENPDSLSGQMERTKSDPSICLYSTLQNKNQSYGYRLDTKERQKYPVSEIPPEKKRVDMDLVDCVKIRGGKCSDQLESDSHSPNMKTIPVANCKPISICNLFPYDNITHSDNKGHTSKCREPLHPQSSLLCKKIKDTEPRKPTGWKSPLKATCSVDEGKKINRQSQVAGRKDSEYCHIIKKVLRQYDHSKLPARNKKDGETKFSYILAPS